jgi:hypothetical protein
VAPPAQQRSPQVRHCCPVREHADCMAPARFVLTRSTPWLPQAWRRRCPMPSQRRHSSWPPLLLRLQVRWPGVWAQPGGGAPL